MTAAPGRRRLLASAAVGVAVLPATLVARSAVALLSRAAGTDLDAVHLLLAPGDGLGGYLAGIVLFRAVTFAAVTAGAIAWSWRRWSRREGLTTGVVAIAAGLVVAGMSYRAASDTAAGYERAAAEARDRVERSLSVGRPESHLEDPLASGRFGTLSLGLPLRVERPGSYRFYLRLAPVSGSARSASGHTFELDTVVELDRGAHRLPMRLDAEALQRQRGLLWWWRDDGVTRAELTVGLLLGREELEELGGLDLDAAIERLRRAGARPGDLESLRPPAGRPVHKFVSRDTFRIEATPEIRTTAP